MSTDTTSTDNNSTKRRKTAPTVGLIDIPDQLLVAISEYLVLPSRALLAVALTAPSSSPQWGRDDLNPSHLSKATKGVLMSDGNIISGNRWDRLDFGQIKRHGTIDGGLAGKLTDDDVSSVLSCVKSTGNDVRRFGICDTMNITSKGLEPLRGSTILEQLDIGEHPDMSLLTILESIIDAGGSALKHIKGAITARTYWKGVPIEELSQKVQQFFQRYDQFLVNRHPSCTGCNEEVVPFDTLLHLYPRNRIGCQINTCHECLNYFCGNCSQLCSGCNKCSECVTGTIRQCDGLEDVECSENYWCQECRSNCSQCPWSGCRDCVNACGCGILFCNECKGGYRDGFINCCDCHNTLCSTCLPLKFENTNVACDSCFAVVTPVITRLREEITQLRGENEELRSKGN